MFNEKTKKMIDLNKLEAKIDRLFENETSDSLTKWLLNKRFGNINILLGNGRFVSMRSHKTPLFSNSQKPNFKQKENNFIPINRQAA